MAGIEARQLAALVGSMSVDTETDTTADAAPSSSRRPKAVVAAAAAVAVCGGVTVTYTFAGATASPVAKRTPEAQPISRAVGHHHLVHNRSRMGCANWQDVSLTKEPYTGQTQESCNKLCSETCGCFYANWQCADCTEPDFGPGAGSCYLFGAGCKLATTNCWDLNVAPGPPGFELVKCRIGCSNWQEISIKEASHVDNVYQCGKLCSDVHCHQFNFAPETGHCHVFKEGCDMQPVEEYDLYKAIPKRLNCKYTYTTKYIEPPYHHIIVNDLSGMMPGSDFMMLDPNMKAGPDGVVQRIETMKLVMIDAPLKGPVPEGTLIYYDCPMPTPKPTPAPEPTPAPTKATDAPTNAPTNAPTSAPTTPAPTKPPQPGETPAPTAAPTAAPTNAPTAAPTAAPTFAPTFEPTNAPTFAPTPAPSKNCYPVGTSVRVIIGSRYCLKKIFCPTYGYCAYIGPEPLCSDKPSMLTFGNGFEDAYELRDVEHYDCPPTPKQVSLGKAHTAVVKTDGSLWTAGSDEFGQLADGLATSADRAALQQVFTGVTMVDLGGSHTGVLKNDGTVWTAGQGKSGQLADGALSDRNALQQASGFQGAQMISLGRDFTAALKEDGTVWTSGRNLRGQLADGANIDRATFQQVFVDAQTVSLGGSHAAFLKKDGSLWTAGQGSAGQLGDGEKNSRNTPQQVFSGVEMVSISGSSSAVMKADGSVWTAGSGGSGQLADGQNTDRSNFQQVCTGAQSVVMGGRHIAVLLKDGTLQTAGRDGDGQLADGESGAGEVQLSLQSIFYGVESVALGTFHTVVIKDHEVLTAGFNLNGQLADGGKTSRADLQEVA